MADKFDLAQETRQAILDFANKVGRVTSREAFDVLGYNLDNAYRSMTRMAENGELLKHGKGIAVYFTPLKTITQSADEMRVNQYKTRKSNKEIESRKQKERRKKQEPWVTRSSDLRDPLRDPPLKNQGGQSSSGSSSWRRSTAQGWV